MPPPPPPRARTVLLQLFQGKISDAVEACSRAVDLCQQDDDNTPDTEALGQVDQRLMYCPESICYVAVLSWIVPATLLRMQNTYKDYNVIS